MTRSTTPSRRSAHKAHSARSTRRSSSTASRRTSTRSPSCFVKPRVVQFGGDAFMTTQRFDALPLKPTLLRALQDVFQYQTMSKPQALTLPVALEGKDILLRSSTGSGKTLTFLLAALQRHLSSKMAAGELGVLILAPLREVAAQTQLEAQKLLKFLPSRGAQLVIGGSDMGRETRRLAGDPCDVLVATPGRLLDHCANPAFAERLRKVHTVVLDETDRMLDTGFIHAIRKIFALLPPRDERQSILVSATLDKRVMEVAQTLLRPDHAFLSTVEETTGHQVNDRIQLRLQQLAPEHILFGLEQALLRDRKKTLVFFPASNWASFATQLFQAAGHTNVAEFHSKLNQNQRTRTLARFKDDPSGVLFASDAAARGLDIRDIDRVIQIGLTDVAGFVQRSGRTGRAGREGESIWILGTDESALLREFKEVPLKPMEPPLITVPSTAMQKAIAQLPSHGDLRRAVQRAFLGTLGAYAAPRKRLVWDAQTVVDQVKARFAGVGLAMPPAVDPKTLGKMNLKGVTGLAIPPRESSSRAEKNA